MTHYFNEPNSFRVINCKSVPGERARKACREWNKLVQLRNKLRAEGRIQEAEDLERPYVEFWNFKEQLVAPKKKVKQKNKRRK